MKIFEANLTDYDRQVIEAKRESKRAEWWSSMSSEERTEYINKLRTAAAFVAAIRHYKGEKMRQIKARVNKYCKEYGYKNPYVKDERFKKIS